MKIIIVGGVAGGMSAATRLRRLMEDAEITIFDERFPLFPLQTAGFLTMFQEKLQTVIVYWSKLLKVSRHALIWTCDHFTRSSVFPQQSTL